MKSFLARGGMADLYIVEPVEKPGKEWVLKLYRWDNTIGDMLLTRFQSAAQLLQNLRHPALPVIKEYFLLPDGFVLIREYIPGRDLEALGSERLLPFPGERVIRWGIELCDVLEYLHSRVPPVILKDLRPPNLIPDRRDHIRIVDVELSSTEHDLCDFLPTGSPRFVAPEVLAGEKPSPGSDLYSLATTLFYLVTLNRPTRDNLEILRHGEHDIPGNLVEAIIISLDHKPENRFKSAAEFKRFLVQNS
ncbi:MAG: protein kinase [Candidatus Eremiobacteraeota bacterium]|nr:protein kinase [Candidatus Eremiobacteraeota bacterium]